MSKKVIEPIKEETPVEPEATAHQRLAHFLKHTGIQLDYEVVQPGVVESDDSFLLVASKVPVIKIKAKYAV